MGKKLSKSLSSTIIILVLDVKKILAQTIAHQNVSYTT